MKERKSISDQIYELATGEEDARVCKDIPEQACNHLPYNFSAQLFTQFFTKIADEIASAKLIFPWVLSLLGAPLFLINLSVPIRESGVLLPQLVVAASIRARPLRKYVWMTGALLTAIALWACSFLLLIDISPKLQAIGVFVSLVVFSLARGISSVAAKDVLGKTVSKSRRGTLTGLATTLSGFATLTVGLLLLYNPSVKSSYFALAGLFFMAGVCWLIASLSIASLRELPGAVEGGKNAIVEAIKSLSILYKDKPFYTFVLTRASFLCVPLSLPLIVMLAQQADLPFTSVGLFMIAAGMGNFLSGYVWGRLSDWSSRKVLILCGVLYTVIVAAFIQLSHSLPTAMARPEAYVASFFLLSIVLAGVRTSRKTQLVDMATIETRAAYVAVSNTVIGLFIVVFGGVVAIFSGQNPLFALTIFGAIGVIATLIATLFLQETN